MASSQRGTPHASALAASVPWMPRASAPTPVAFAQIAHTGMASFWRGRSGTNAATAAIAATPIGTLTQNTAGQPPTATSSPPSSGPAATAAPPTAPQVPSATARRGGWNSALMRVRHCGVISAAPMPWATRHPMRAVMVGASAHRSDPSVKAASPTRWMRRWP